MTVYMCVTLCASWPGYSRGGHHRPLQVSMVTSSRMDNEHRTQQGSEETDYWKQDLVGR
ncbi:hypothetical protein SRHO_G00055040 [Serrasalmus rhombeus]